MTPKTKSFSSFQKSMKETLRAVRRGQTFVLTEEKAAPVVVTSGKTFARMEDELIMRRAIAAGEAEIAAGRLISHEQAMAKLEESLGRWASNGRFKRSAGSKKSSTTSRKTSRSARNGSLRD